MRLPVLTSAALAATLVAAVAGPASAADPEKGAGSALSAGSLVQLSVAGQALEALRLSMPTSTGTDGAKALISVTPLLKDDQAVVPPVQVTAGEAREVPAQQVGVAGLLGLTTPSGSISASTDAVGALAETATGVGDLSLLGTDLLGEGSFTATSKVTDVSSTGTKHLVVDSLTLPTLADLLAALGLDLAKLPVGTLLDLLERLKLVTPQVITQLRNLVSALKLATAADLQAALAGDLTAAQTTALLAATGDAATDATVTELQKTITTLEGELATMQASNVRASAIGDLTSGVGGAIGGLTGGTGTGTGGTGTGGTGTVDLGDGLLGGVIGTLDPTLVGDLTGDVEAVLDNPTVASLTALIDSLTKVLQDLVQDLLDTLVGGQLPALPDLAALLDTPLLSVGKLDVTTVARTGADELADVTGTVSGLEVLGTDVLNSVLGTSTIDIATLLGGGSLTQVQQLVDGTLGSVTDVLGDVTGLNLPLPEVEVLRLVEETITDVDGVRTARAGVEALALTWALDEVRIPAAVSSVVGGVTGGLPVSLPLGVQASALPTDQLTALLSEPMTLVIGNLTDTSGFVPGAPVAAPGTGTPGTGTPGTGNPGTVLNPAPVRQLPRTGASALLAGAALALIGGAFALRRRNEGLAAD